MGPLIATILAQLAHIDIAGIAKDKLVPFVNAELKRRIRHHVKSAADGATRDGWTYAKTTEERPVAPAALIGDLIYRLEKGTVPGGKVRDFIRDHVEQAVTAKVAPQITEATSMLEIAQLTAEAAIEVVF